MNESVVIRILKKNLKNSKELKCNDKIATNPFKWDGSYLGEVTNLKYLFEDYCQIEINLYVGYGKIKRSLTVQPCIIDEMKIIFGLPKMGTHWFTYKNKVYILTKVKTKKLEFTNFENSNSQKSEITNYEFQKSESTNSENSEFQNSNSIKSQNEKVEIVVDKYLNEVNILHPKFVQQVQATFVFQDLMGLRKPNIVIRYSDNYLYYPISTDEKQVVIREGETISKKNYNTWLPRGTYGIILKRLLDSISSESTVFENGESENLNLESEKSKNLEFENSETEKSEILKNENSEFLKFENENCQNDNEDKDFIYKYTILSKKIYDVINRIDSKYNYLTYVILKRITSKIAIHSNNYNPDSPIFDFIPSIYD